MINETLCFAPNTALLSYCDSIVQHLKSIHQANNNQNIICCEYICADHDSENGSGDIDSRMQIVIDNTTGNALKPNYQNDRSWRQIW